MKKYLIGLGMMVSMAFFGACANGNSNNQTESNSGKLKQSQLFILCMNLPKK